MFVKAIEIAQRFTRPIHSAYRYYGSTNIYPGAATLFIVNSDGWAITAKHVALQIPAIQALAEKRLKFKKELNEQSGKKKMKHLLRELENKYHYKSTEVYELLFRMINCVEGGRVSVKVHPTRDIALIHFDGFSKLLCDSFPTFGANDSELKQGKFLCRLGFPFPEFSNFTYDEETESIKWTQEGRQDTPQFPIEGMLTRHLVERNDFWGFEMSTPGLRGQSGGPVFDAEGRVWGMQSATNHLDLDFDVEQEVIRNGLKKKASDKAFLHVGHCIHVNALKNFMRENNVSFQEG